jgi:hypothetical protein
VSSIVRAPQLSSYTFLPKRSSNKLLLGLTLGLVISALACGSNGGSFVPVKGPFSTASLSGSYTYILEGTDTSGNPFTEGGVFMADGNGNITSGTDDFNQSNLQGTNFVSHPTKGTYQIIPDGSGTISFTLTDVTSNNTFQFAINLVNTSQFYLAENDAFANAAGIADKQDSAALTVTPHGSFAFRVHAYGSVESEGMVGQLVSTAGTVAGNADILRSATLTAATLSGTFQAPDNTGRGVLTYQDTVTNPSFEYYIINANTIRLLGKDANVLALGRAELQSGGPFNANSLSGNYAFGSVGNLSVNDGGMTRTVGTFTAGSGSISAGAFDAVVNGNVIANNLLQTPGAGSYTVNANGETQLTLNPSGGVPVQEILWLVSPSRAFVLVNDSTKVEDGTVDVQASTSFTNSNLSGQYGLVMEGITSSDYLTRVGTFIPDGNGNLTLNELVNAFTPAAGASFNSPSLTGTYTVGSNGRVAATIVPSTSPNIDLVLYMVSPNQAYILQGDTGFEVSGSVALQSSP